MKLLETAGKTIKTAATAVVKAVTQPDATARRDPWYLNDRRAELDGRGSWLGPRRKGWLR